MLHPPSNSLGSAPVVTCMRPPGGEGERERESSGCSIHQSKTWAAITSMNAMEIAILTTLSEFRFQFPFPLSVISSCPSLAPLLYATLLWCCTSAVWRLGGLGDQEIANIILVARFYIVTHVHYSSWWV